MQILIVATQEANGAPLAPLPTQYMYDPYVAEVEPPSHDTFDNPHLHQGGKLLCLEGAYTRRLFATSRTCSYMYHGTYNRYIVGMYVFTGDCLFMLFRN